MFTETKKLDLEKVVASFRGLQSGKMYGEGLSKRYIRERAYELLVRLGEDIVAMQGGK